MSINGTFRFHNIGQGLFYSGIIGKREGQAYETFSFVYDCGTESNKKFLEREIDDFKLLIPNKKSSYKKKLDLLVVSHLHDDHVNGLEYLLKDFDVETVVMPYTDEELRLISRIESISEEPFLQIFYTDPVSWFASNGVKRVFLLGYNGELTDENKHHDYTMDSDMHVDDSSILGKDIVNGTEVIYLNNKSRITHEGISWVFLFENLPIKHIPNGKIVQVVEEFKNKNNLTLEQIFKSKVLTSSLREVLNNQITGLKDIINRTSVIMMHRPNADSKIIESDIGVTCFHSNCDICSRLRFVGCITKCKKMGSLLTGDITLDDEDININILENNRIPDDCCNPIIFQYPHHGSQKNNTEVFAKIIAHIKVISCGINNRYGHPCAEVIEKLSNCVIVNERNAFDYTIAIQNDN